MHIHLAKSKGECLSEILHADPVPPTMGRTKSPGYDSVPLQKYSHRFRYHSKQTGPWRKSFGIMKSPDASMRTQHHCSP